MDNSPLGKYSAITAAIAALIVICSWILGELMYGLNIIRFYPAGLKEAALLALGAVFGSAVAVNGYKAPLLAAHKRLDLLGAPPANDGEEV